MQESLCKLAPEEGSLEAFMITSQAGTAAAFPCYTGSLESYRVACNSLVCFMRGVAHLVVIQYATSCNLEGVTDKLERSSCLYGDATRGTRERRSPFLNRMEAVFALGGYDAAASRALTAAGERAQTCNVHAPWP